MDHLYKTLLKKLHETINCKYEGKPTNNHPSSRSVVDQGEPLCMIAVALSDRTFNREKRKA